MNILQRNKHVYSTACCRFDVFVCGMVWSHTPVKHGGAFTTNTSYYWKIARFCKVYATLCVIFFFKWKQESSIVLSNQRMNHGLNYWFMEKIRICYNVENKNRSKIYILNLSQKKYISSKDIYIYNPVALYRWKRIYIGKKKLISNAFYFFN